VLATQLLRTTHYLPVDPCLHGPNMFGTTCRLVTHLHGGRVQPESDGYPEATVLPGQTTTLYTYPNGQLPATMWYHDHALGLTRLNVYMGLAAFYLIRDAFENGLVLPTGDYEMPLLVQDRSFNPDGTLKYPAAWQEDFFGDFMLVNGKVWPFMNVKRGKYRLRLVNGCTSRVLTLGLSDGGTFHVIGNDLGMLPAAVPVTKITLSPGERVDTVFNFAPYTPGAEVTLVNSAPRRSPASRGSACCPT
jgi:spore coat protein A